MVIARDTRLSGRTSTDDRTPFQIDRDRILYSMSFRRLAGVTQVVSPGEGEIFHSRLTHSLKVAQIARRFAESLPKKFKKQLEGWGGLDPDVVEAAALAHDLGHPPFGHLAEETLAHLMSKEICEEKGRKPDADEFEGYEGNAQSFRILTNLSVRRGKSKTRTDPDYGLDLTVATLNASLKYPWKWHAHPRKPRKYGVYESDGLIFDEVRKGAELVGTAPVFARTLEAQIMDWSDDIAYSVHDTEDFYRAGLIPLDRLGVDGPERDRFRKHVIQRAPKEDFEIDEDFESVFEELFEGIRVRTPYEGGKEDQQRLSDFVSHHINEFVTNTSILEPPGEAGEAILVPKEIRLQVFFLKQLVWAYVIENPALASHQLGHRRAIETLFREYNLAAKQKNWHLFPALFRDRAIKLDSVHAAAKHMPVEDRVRLVADTISSMSDQQALAVYRQFTGVSLTSMLHRVVT